MSVVKNNHLYIFCSTFQKCHWMRKSDLSSSPSSFGRSKLRLSLSPGIAELIKPNEGYSLALIEFHQGHTPQTLWSYGMEEMCDDLLWAVITAPLTFDDPPVCPPPSIMYSSFGSKHYMAQYTTIPDIQARGFSRIIAFYIGNQNRNLINFLRGHFSDFVSQLLLKMQKNAMHYFLPEFIDYAGSLLFHSQENQQLSYLVSEIQRISTYLNLTITPNSDSAAKIPIDIFTTQHINNDLRPIRLLVNFEELQPDIDHITTNLPTDLFKLSLPIYGKTRLSSPRLDLGTFSMEELFYSDQYPYLASLTTGGILCHIAYALLSGRTLCIESPINQNVKDLVSKLACFLPGKPKITFYEEKTETIRTIENSISIAPEFIDSDLKSSQIAFYSRSKHYYRGPICSPECIIWKYLYNATISTEFTFCLYIRQKLKVIENLFILEMAKWSNNVPNNESKMQLAMTQAGLNVDDDELYSYWVLILANGSNLKPVVLGKDAKTGIGYVADYS